MLKGPMKRAGKVCGDSQDLKSPGKESLTRFGELFTEIPFQRGGVNSHCIGYQGRATFGRIDF